MKILLRVIFLVVLSVCCVQTVSPSPAKQAVRDKATFTAELKIAGQGHWNVIVGSNRLTPAMADAFIASKIKPVLPAQEYPEILDEWSSIGQRFDGITCHLSIYKERPVRVYAKKQDAHKGTMTLLKKGDIKRLMERHGAITIDDNGKATVTIENARE